jgi:TRAP transporter 4TM/12TM fusion protein
MAASQTDRLAPRSPPAQRIAGWLFYVAAAAFFASLSSYYLTGAGGPTLLAVTMVPLAVCVAFLHDARRGELYPRFGAWVGLVAAVSYSGIAVVAAAYLVSELEEIRIYRVGLWNARDLLAGGAVAALVLEYGRRRYLPLFVLTLLLLLYSVYGYGVPGLFHHPGIPWSRVVSAASVEMSTGIFDRLAQLGLTVIGAFILVLSTLRAFDCIEAILKGSSRLSARAPALLPQTAVAGSFAVAAVSGSGAANAATTGSATIPALIRAGFPPVRAAAIETASSLGGQLMPPLMGIAAFMMAELLGVGYFEVVARGFAPALLYFLGVVVGVHLLALRHRGPADAPPAEAMGLGDAGRIAGYLFAVAGLIYLMGVQRQPAMTSAHTVFLWLLAVLGSFHLARCAKESLPLRAWLAPVGRLIESFSLITAELVVLLATLGIVTAAFTVTGVPDKVGVLVMRMADVHFALMVLVAFAFGYLVGMGLPVAPTYIVVAVIVTPFMVRAGVDPWVAHFFAFFVAVFGELSPPTSVTAAVTSRIADTSFMRTMVAALGLCIPLLTMTFAVFSRPALVTTPGAAQIPAFLLVATGTLGIIVALQGRFHVSPSLDGIARSLLALGAVATLLHPNDATAWLLAAGVGAGAIALVARTARLSRTERPRS